MNLFTLESPAVCQTRCTLPLDISRTEPHQCHPDFRLIGHRGAGGVAPENTLAAIGIGSRSGAEFIEIDLQLSQDGQPFVFHDSTPQRTTNVADVFPHRVNDPITTFTWEELQCLDAGAYFSEQFAGQKIPHLNQVPAALDENTGVFIELKNPKNSPGIEELLANTLVTHPAWSKLVHQNKIEVLGFDAVSNKKFAQLAPTIALQQLSDTVPVDEVLRDYASYASCLGTNYQRLSRDGAQRVHRAGLNLGVYTVNSLPAIGWLLDRGVERVTTDLPEQVHQLRPEWR